MLVVGVLRSGLMVCVCPAKRCMVCVCPVERCDGLCVSCKALWFVCVLQSAATVCVCPAKRCDGLCVSCKALRCVCPAERCMLRRQRPGRGDRLEVGWHWEGHHKNRRCSRHTYPESCIANCTSIRRQMFLYTKTNVFVYEDKCFCIRRQMFLCVRRQMFFCIRRQMFFCIRRQMLFCIRRQMLFWQRLRRRRLPFDTMSLQGRLTFDDPS